MRLCCTSPKALRRSMRDTTRLLAFPFPSAIKWVRSSVCSLTPSIFGQKPFWIFLSMKSLSDKKLYTLFFRIVVNILHHTGCSVVGLKLAGSDVSPFLQTRIVAALFQHIGMYLCLKHSAIMMWSSERNIGHRFSMIIESWSSGQADALLLHLLTALATSLYNGGLSWHGMVGNCSFGIHDEIANLFPRFKFDSTFWK